MTTLEIVLVCSGFFLCALGGCLWAFDKFQRDMKRIFDRENDL